MAIIRSLPIASTATFINILILMTPAVTSDCTPWDEKEIELSEFDYGQRALYGEKCDFARYEQIVRPIMRMSAAKNPKWVEAHDKYRKLMMKDLKLRSLTCHSSHLMQCSSSVNGNGDHFCECLQEGPSYDMNYDTVKKVCTSKPKVRCFSPFGYECPTGSYCMQANQPSLIDGECICVEEAEIPGFKPGDLVSETCTGCASDAIQGDVYPYP